ncbi:MAG: DUF480 domain-containing protein [Actinomycetota bacterium]
MELSPEQARVLAALIEKEAAVPDSYPLTLNALRQACNQSNNRNPVVSYDDRTIDNALLSLKSIGLVRFVHPSHGGRTTRYRHIANERWQLEAGELVVLAMVTLRGPSTEAEVRSRVERLLPDGSPAVAEALDTLMARRPEPFVARLERQSGEREPRYAHLLSGEHDESALDPVEVDDEPEPAMAPAAPPVAAPAPAPTSAPASAPVGAPAAAPVDDRRLAALEDEVEILRKRLDQLERALGVADDDYA